MAEFSPDVFVLTTLTGLVAGYIGSALSQNRTRRQDRGTFAKALYTEISLLRKKLEALRDGVREGAMPNLEKLPLFIDNHDMIVFTSNTSKVGLFFLGLPMAIISFYASVRFIQFESTTASVDKIEEISEQCDEAIMISDGVLAELLKIYAYADVFTYWFRRWSGTSSSDEARTAGSMSGGNSGD